MKEKITQHFNKVFAGAPRTRNALDLKQEMVQSALDKYDDMVADGYSQEDAYQNVIESIGDVTELFNMVEEERVFLLPEKDRQRRALLISFAVGLYLLAAAALFFFSSINEIPGFLHIDYNAFAIVPTILLCIPPTMMIVYALNRYPKYTRLEKAAKAGLLVQCKNPEGYSGREKLFIKYVQSIIWTIAVLLFIITTFTTGRIEITWVIFLIAACVQKIVGLGIELKAEEGNKEG